MVDRTGGQLYTIEGFAAALIMVVTAWIVLGTTSVYTPGDSHISDMQLEQLGNDALMVLDTPINATYTCIPPGCTVGVNSLSRSALQDFIENKDGNGPVLFNNMFLSYCNNRTDGTRDRIQYNASIFYRKQTVPPAMNETKTYLFYQSRNLTAGDHAVRVTHWVLVDDDPVPPAWLPATDYPDSRPQAVLLEVLLWRD